MSAEFIKMVSDLQFERFNVHLAELANSRTPCGIFFGFAFYPQAAAANVQSLVRTGLNITCAIVLADVQADALKTLTDVPVVTLEKLSAANEKPQEIFIPDVVKDLAFVPYFERYGITAITMLYAGQQDGYFSLMMRHLPDLYSVYEMLGDDESKKTFRAAIKGRLTGKVSNYRFAPEPQYLLYQFMPTAGDVAIDGGAYDGATAIDFAKCGAQVYAFEMDAANYKNCAARLDAVGEVYHIVLENFGLSDRESEQSYSAHGTGSRKDSNGALTAKFIDLDTYAARKNLSRVDFIKLDIEGAELDMLHGAAKTITRCKPKMAISAYHKWEDLWTLTPYIKSLRPDYEFEFRHYRVDFSDYDMNDAERAVLRTFGLSYLAPNGGEFVLYCK